MVFSLFDVAASDVAIFIFTHSFSLTEQKTASDITRLLLYAGFYLCLKTVSFNDQSLNLPKRFSDVKISRSLVFKLSPS